MWETDYTATSTDQVRRGGDRRGGGDEGDEGQGYMYIEGGISNVYFYDFFFITMSLLQVTPDLPEVQSI